MLTHIVEATKGEQPLGAFEPDYPNRVNQVDTDGAVYHVANVNTSLKGNFNGLLNYLDTIRANTGSEYIMTHTTMALKGGRHEVAYYQTYQKGRGHQLPPELKARVVDLRSMLHDYRTEIITPCPQWYVEADDSLSQAHNDLIRSTGDDRISVISSGDKDLKMNPGLFYCMNTKEVSMQGKWNGLFWEDSFGYSKAYKPKPKSQAKLDGRGLAMFWSQMLAGDGADHIAGLPYIYGEALDYYIPLKSRKRRSSDFRDTCGIATAVKVVSHCRDDKSAYNVVSALYKRHFKSDWQFFFFENAFLLWMRRSNRVLDVLEYLRPLGFEYELHSQQKAAINDYLRKCHELERR